MENLKIFAKVLCAVSEITEISTDEILSKNRSVDIVDARAIVVRALHFIGYYPKQIARLMGMTSANVRRILTQFADRKAMSKQLARNTNKIRKHIESNFFAAELA